VVSGALVRGGNHALDIPDLAGKGRHIREGILGAPDVHGLGCLKARGRTGRCMLTFPSLLLRLPLEALLALPAMFPVMMVLRHLLLRPGTILVVPAMMGATLVVMTVMGAILVVMAMMGAMFRFVDVLGWSGRRLVQPLEGCNKAIEASDQPSWRLGLLDDGETGGDPLLAEGGEGFGVGGANVGLGCQGDWVGDRGKLLLGGTE